MREGYKQTEVGVIPSDWEVKQLGEVLRVKHGKDQKEVKSENGLYPILGTGGLMGYANKFIYNSESVLIGRKGTIDKPQYMNTPFWTVDTLFYTEIQKSYLPKFLFYKFNLIDWYSYNEASGVPSLNARTIEKIEISLPPTKAEQTAIAEVLSDADTLIRSLEKLIAKKRLIKQGAMQELLKPKEGWVVKRLGEIGALQGGSGFPQKFQGETEGIIPFYKVSDMNKEGNDLFMRDSNNWINQETKKKIGAKVFPTNSIVFAKIGAAVFLERKRMLTMESCLDNNMMGFICEDDVYDTKYIYYLFLRIRLGRLVNTTALPSLSGKEISNLEFYFPPIEEQTRIATILSDMDAEITALETKLDKYKQIKQGMMQELLTGRIRLI